MKTTIKMIRNLSLRKLVLVVVLTDVVLACVVAVLVARCNWFGALRGMQRGEGKATKAVSAAKSRPDAQHIGTDAEPQELPVFTESTRSLRPASDRKPVEAGVDLAGGSIIIVAAIFAFALVTPTAVVVCFFVLLRRHIERLGALIQANQAALPQGSAMIPPASAGVSPSSAAAPLFAPEEPPRPQGGALFERLFEETLELQNLITTQKETI